MATHTSKYLQLPDASSCDIGKPSPLALLTATCRKIGTSPRVSSRRVLSMRTTSPQSKHTALPITHVSTSSCSYLPPTPPPSPPMQIDVTSPSSSPALSMSPQPLPLRSVSPVISGHQPCYYPQYQPVMRYSPYSTPPLSRPRVPPSSMSYHAASTPYFPCTPMMIPTYNHTLLHPHSPSLFGVYPHHDQPVHATMPSMKVRHTRNRRTRQPDVENEDIIDVVSI
ncbi:extensin isoform X4 [Strongylocentrotus purpuratus]|uniref:Uncharacterized protein n=1 Tax=Strongylocentrotus purpuratus TaxID=7668 RepID=A0A7M7GLA2_STRPU|nr:extensin isoform X2 [Strongylocentrotus purpuratus]XP_030847656.1 extensin isoform X3 [Strongylocentrotus purpuratus]XP_030847657.1 extensin isoform X4 [Strongylocentrotus purpuratus]